MKRLCQGDIHRSCTASTAIFFSDTPTRILPLDVRAVAMNRAAHLLKAAIRRSANLLGYDVVGHDSHSHRWRMARFFAQSGITTVFDVGANRGEYGWELREMGFGGNIVSFEPLQDAFALLAASAKADPRWQAVN